MSVWQNPYLPEGCTDAMIEEAYGYDLPNMPQCASCQNETCDVVEIDDVLVCVNCLVGEHDWNRVFYTERMGVS